MRLIQHQHFIDKLAFLNSIVSGVALYPQIWKMIEFGTAGVSVFSFSLIFLNSLVWVAYAAHRTLLSLAITSILNMVASGIILLLIIVGQ